MAILSFYSVVPQVSDYSLHKYTQNLQLIFTEIEATAIHQKSKSDVQWQSQDPGCVEYSVVTPGGNLDLNNNHS